MSIDTYSEKQRNLFMLSMVVIVFGGVYSALFLLCLEFCTSGYQNFRKKKATYHYHYQLLALYVFAFLLEWHYVSSKPIRPLLVRK